VHATTLYPGHATVPGVELHAAAVGAMIGPMQVTGRVLELAFASRLSASTVGILAMALLVPFWLPGEQRSAPFAKVRIVLAAALVGALLQLMLLLAALCGGLLASPRADLMGEWRDLLSGLLLGDVLRSMARAALFLASICGWTIWRPRAGHASMRHRELLTSNLLVEGLMVLMGLKLTWIMVVEPLRLSASPQ
jgi:hypothetical protein